MSIAEKLTTVAENQQRVYEAGKKAEWSAFWDACQHNGNRTTYNYAFWNWHPDMFKPKYNMTPTNCNNMFYNLFSGNKASLKAILEECGVTLDTSNSTNFQAMFGYSYVTEAPVISTISASALAATFDNAKLLVTIEKLILKDDGSQTFTNTFRACNKLENIVIEGVIGDNLDMSACPLSKSSFVSVLEALTINDSGKTLTLNKAAKEAAFVTTEELDTWNVLTGQRSNWTISLK